MNRYFGTARNYGKTEHSRNMTIAAVRSAVLNNKVIMLYTATPEKWHTVLRAEFPDVPLKIVENGVMINDREK